MPLSPYGVAKLAVEGYLRVFLPDSAILRLSNVYGPRQNSKGEAGVVAIFLNQILDHKPLHIFGDGEQTRDFVYVKDVVNAFVAAMENDLAGIFNVATKTKTSVNAIVEKLMAHFDPTCTFFIKTQYCPAISGELQHSVLEYTKLEKACGWQPAYTFERGLKETINYFTGSM
jgi:UDP-glucose 4-epimerase